MRVGSVELLAVEDARGTIGELTEMYPGTSIESWEPYRGLYRELFAGDSWRLSCKSYVVRSGSRTILLDTGVGPPGIWSWQPEYEARLLPGLAAIGVAPDDVDVVLVSHVHIDHVGWNTDLEGRVVFPRARYVLHRDAAAVVPERTGPDRPHIERCIVSLLDRGVVDLVDGETELADGVVTLELPGHDLGHTGLRILSGGADAVLFVDAAPHPALFEHPGWRFVGDTDPPRAEATRLALIPQLRDGGTLAVCGHYPGDGIGRVVTRDGRVVWEPV